MGPNSKAPDELDFLVHGLDLESALDEFGAEDLLGRDIGLEGSGDWESI